MKLIKRKHVMISYNWGTQKLAKVIARILRENGIPVWMDIDGGIAEGDINACMASGVEGAICVVCLVTRMFRKSEFNSEFTNFTLHLYLLKISIPNMRAQRKVRKV